MIWPKLTLLVIFWIAFLSVESKKQYPKKYRPNVINEVDDPIVIIRNGVIRGRKSKTFDKATSFYAFQGIPFAKPPIENLRFRSPQPPENWPGVLNATEDGSVCVQGITPNRVNGSEDCLFINVYTPRLYDNLPVMVWIYGGGFIGGDSTYNIYGPDFFMNEDIIFVSFNYRVGIFGFLSTEDEEAPGNYGLKDQLLALKWVRENIEIFGGNPEKVTLVGESAGAASVAYLVQSPLTSGLFRGAVTISGSSLCQWSLSRRARGVAFLTGAVLRANVTTSKTLIEDLRKVPYRELHSVSTVTDYASLLVLNPLNGLVFAPVIERPHENAIVTNKTYEMLKLGMFNKVPQIIGFNSQEGVPFLDVINFVRLYLLSYDISPTRLVPVDMNLPNISLQKLLAAIQIRFHYFGLLGIIAFTRNQVVHYVSDDQFVRPINEAVQLISKHCPVYYFRFSYEGDIGDTNRTAPGVGHGEDLKYMFRTENEEFNETSQDNLTRYRLIRLWSNFVKYGNPTPYKEELLQNITWPIANPKLDGNLTFLDLNSDITIDSNLQEDDMTFWKELYDTYGTPPYDTY